jgi:hypothetical protein
LSFGLLSASSKKLSEFVTETRVSISEQSVDSASITFLNLSILREKGHCGRWIYVSFSGFIGKRFVWRRLEGLENIPFRRIRGPGGFRGDCFGELRSLIRWMSSANLLEMFTTIQPETTVTGEHESNISRFNLATLHRQFFWAKMAPPLSDPGRGFLRISRKIWENLGIRGILGGWSLTSNTI